MESASPPPGLSIFFPAYNDAGTIASMVVAAELTARRWRRTVRPARTGTLWRRMMDEPELDVVTDEQTNGARGTAPMKRPNHQKSTAPSVLPSVAAATKPGHAAPPATAAARAASDTSGATVAAKNADAKAVR